MRNYIIILSIEIMLLMQACTVTTTKEKKPLFSVSSDSVGNQLNKLVQAESIEVAGGEITTNGKKKTLLEIDVINAKRLSCQ